MPLHVLKCKVMCAEICRFKCFGKGTWGTPNIGKTLQCSADAWLITQWHFQKDRMDIPTYAYSCAGMLGKMAQLQEASIRESSCIASGVLNRVFI